MSPDSIRVFAGECSVSFHGEEVREERGSVVVVAKPDNTVLVHDHDGYRPVAWLTRADTVSYDREGDGFVLEAARDGQGLRVVCHREFGDGSYPVSPVGTPVGSCPDCDGVLVHVNSAVACLGCGSSYGIPGDATVLDARCESCGLPHMQVERGEPFELCVDRTCSSLDDHVRDRFDRAWSCPECQGDLLILRRGGLLAGCENYPACETGFSIPAGTVDGACPDCGLPVFDTGTERRCLDATCSGAA